MQYFFYEVRSVTICITIFYQALNKLIFSDFRMNIIFVAVAIFLACVGASNGFVRRELSQVEDEFGIKEADGGKVASRFGYACKMYDEDDPSCWEDDDDE